MTAPHPQDPLKEKVIAARAAYRATLDETGRGSEELYRAMEEAEAEWDAAPDCQALRKEMGE